jgi:hypothetical protein
LVYVCEHTELGLLLLGKGPVLWNGTPVVDTPMLPPEKVKRVDVVVGAVHVVPPPPPPPPPG